MNPARPARGLLGAVLGLVLLLLAAPSVRGEQPFDPGIPSIDRAAFQVWQPHEFQQAPDPLRCEQIRFTDAPSVSLVLTDADLIAESDGSRLCLFWEEQWQSYVAWLINQRSIAEFRRSKSDLQPLLASAGIDPCQIGAWTADDPAIRARISLADQQDTGVRCEPEIIAHGPAGGSRLEEVRASLRAAIETGEQAFRWSLVRPIRVHLYDNNVRYTDGVRLDGGEVTVSEQSLSNTPALTRTLPNGMQGLLLDLSAFSQPSDLRMVLSHEYAHVAQSGVTGCSCFLPFFVKEGGAEYFASLVVGAQHRNLAGRFDLAVDDERTGQAVPLRELIDEPPDSDRRRTAAGYSRGYAAMRLLTERWGADGFTRLNLDTAAGPEQTIGVLTTITGLSLDDFDRELSASLRTRGAAASPAPSPSPSPLPPASPRPTPAPSATPAPPANSLLVRIYTARPAPGTLVEAASFSRAATSVAIIVEWRCLDRPRSAEARLIAPNGDQFARYDATAGPGCNLRGRIDLDLDDTRQGPSIRSRPGVWRVEIHVDGVLQGSAAFTVEP